MKSLKYEIDSKSENEIVEEELSESDVDAEDCVVPNFEIADRFSSLKAISANNKKTKENKNKD